jgi:hypothetical protein
MEIKGNQAQKEGEMMNEQEPTRIDLDVYDNETGDSAKLRLDNYDLTANKWMKTFVSMSTAKQWLAENGYRWVGSDKFYI